MANANAEGEKEKENGHATTTCDADVRFTNDLTTKCEPKVTQHFSQQQLHAEEIEAIKKAIDFKASEFTELHAGVAMSALEAYGYESQSHGVTEMLEKWLDKSTEQQAGL